MFDSYILKNLIIKKKYTMKRFIFFVAGALLAAMFVMSCEKMEDDFYGSNLDQQLMMMKSASAPQDTTSKKPDVPPQDTTRTVQTPADTTTTVPTTPDPTPDTMFPADFGKLVSFGISEVPAIKDDATGVIHNAAGKMQEFVAADVIFENGAIVVVFEKGRVFPTIEELKAAQFVEGDYAGYNSAYDPQQDGHWLPAIAADKDFGLEYTAKGTVVRSVLNKTLDKWGWSNRNEDGNYSTVVDGYSYSVEDGKMTISFGEDTLILY